MFEQSVATLNARLDEGTHEALMAYVDTVSDADSLYGRLMGISPYVTGATLRNALDGGIMSYGQEYGVLAANPDALRQDGLLTDVIAYFQDAQARSNPPIPDYAGAIVSDAAISTSHTSLEDTIAMSKVAMDGNGFNILWAFGSPVDTNVSEGDTTGAGICTDSNSVYFLQDSNSRYIWFDSVDAWLQDIGGPMSVYERIGFQYSRGNYTAANNIFEAIDEQLLSGLERETYDTFAKMWVVLKAAANDGRTFYQLTADELAAYYVKGDSPLQTDNAARPILRITGSWRDPVDATFEVFCADPKPRAGGTIIKNPFGNNKKHSKYGRLKVYPNPSGGIVTFEYSLPNVANSNDGINIVIFNMLGEKVMEQIAEGNTGKIYWDPQNVPAGVYMYHASTANGIISNGKVVLTR